ncbi:MAG: hypothetical protein HZA13_02345 [Nitrospirae bacterium]|nr:hypothetical protein [Nitrospirota bacterium]
MIVAAFGIFAAITMAWTFFLLPLALILFVGCLILISIALGPYGGDKKKD